MSEASARTLRIIQGLLNQADDSGATPEEQKAFRAQAEHLMREYRIEESEAIQRGEAPSLVPTSRLMFVSPFGNQWYNEYWRMASYVVSHCGLRAVAQNHFDPESGLWQHGMMLVGYDSDLSFAEMLFTSVRLGFAARMEPQFDPTKGDKDNVYRMRNAGMTRDAIAAAMGWLEGENKLTPSAAADKASRLYGQACRDYGSEPRLLGKGTSMKVYKEQYARAFTDEIWYRLREARMGADTERGALVLASRKESVDEAFYEMFPHMRPSTAPVKAQPVKEETEAQRRRREARWERECQEEARKRNSAAGQAGRAAGVTAAREVDLQGVQPTKRLA